MPLYSIQCPKCYDTDEHFMGINDEALRVSCTHCGAYMTRADNRNYAADNIGISGDTCAGSENYSGFDDGLDMEIRSRTHRKQVMAERELTEYVPDTEAKAARTEARYILDNSPAGDVKAYKAAKDQTVAFHKKRTERIVDKKIAKFRKEFNT